MTLKIGDKAPEFELPDASGKNVKLSDFRGKYVVLYFYPKDDTPGCTKEACDFRDYQEQFKNLNAVIIGISRDSQDSHAQFMAKYHLPLILLSDPEHQAIEMYGAWQKRPLLGDLLGIVRSTFLIDPQGRLLRHYPKVSVGGHVAAILEELRQAEKMVPQR